MFEFWINTVHAAGNANELLLSINEKILNPFIGILIGVATVIFLYGVIEFIAGAGNEEKRTKGKQHIVWGIIGLFIMVGVFGIINLILRTLDLI